ncbi:hypothetical protein [uncultured Lactobacillus sp.]|uniref:hypothetical protein n=1 Tax=uncultured Lactobacillus sp. TaxID=153152 RepID=UPI0025E581E5|nr:hypothetical protein [uncultured Lactobacillus sp.]
MTSILLNGKQLCQELNISTTMLYKFRKAGMPYHQLPQGRPYYTLDEAQTWLISAGYHQENTWSK